MSTRLDLEMRLVFDSGQDVLGKVEFGDNIPRAVEEGREIRRSRGIGGTTNDEKGFGGTPRDGDNGYIGRGEACAFRELVTRGRLIEASVGGDVSCTGIKHAIDDGMPRFEFKRSPLAQTAQILDDVVLVVKSPSDVAATGEGEFAHGMAKPGFFAPEGVAGIDRTENGAVGGGDEPKMTARRVGDKRQRFARHAHVEHFWALGRPNRGDRPGVFGGILNAQKPGVVACSNDMKKTGFLRTGFERNGAVVIRRVL